MNRAEKDAQDDFMYESAHRFRDVHDMSGEVSYTVYEPKKITCGEVLIFTLVIGSLIIAAVVYFWR